MSFMPKPTPDNPMPIEVREALEWEARIKLGPNTSQMSVSAWVARANNRELHAARRRHALEAPGYEIDEARRPKK